MKDRADALGDSSRKSKDVRERLLRLLPESSVDSLMEYLVHFQEIREAIEADQVGRSQDARKLALRRLQSALTGLQRALRRMEDPATGGLPQQLEWAFDRSFGRGLLRHHFRRFREYVERAVTVVADRRVAKLGRRGEKARDILDREVVRAVYDAGLLRRSGRGRRSVLLTVLEIVYAYCGYPERAEKTPGVRKALQQFKILEQAETTGRISRIRETVKFTADHYGEK